MKKSIFIIVTLGLVILLIWQSNLFSNNNGAKNISDSSLISTSTTAIDPANSVKSNEDILLSTNTISNKPYEIVVENLKIPWDIAFLPNGDFLVTERSGTLSRFNSIKEKINIPLTGVKHTSEGGLLGMTLHPEYSKNNFIYLYMSSPGQNGKTENKVMRYRLGGNILNDPTVIIDKIPGAIYHDGGRIEFGPDNLLYITTGDATESALAQDKNSLAGKILRLNDDGSIPKDNPFETAVYSFGHRNPQGLAWDKQGKLWQTEHGRSGVSSGYDEINLVEKGKNYGWPKFQGPENKQGYISPALQSGTDSTWAPASLTFANNKLFFGGLRGEALYEVSINENKVSNLKEHFKNKFGRIRTTRLGPDGMLYIMTSNQDSRGKPNQGDDKIIRIDLELL